MLTYKTRRRLFTIAIADVDAFDINAELNSYKDTLPEVDEQGISLAKENAAKLETLRRKHWEFFQSNLNRRLGLNLYVYNSEYSDKQLKALLKNSLLFELDKLNDSRLARITFDRILLILSTLGSIVVNIIQAIK